MKKAIFVNAFTPIVDCGFLICFSIMLIEQYNTNNLMSDSGENNTTRGITERLNYIIKTSNDVHNGKK